MFGPFLHVFGAYLEPIWDESNSISEISADSSNYRCLLCSSSTEPAPAPRWLLMIIHLRAARAAYLGTLSENKNGIMWEKFPSGGPPPPTPPVWEFSHFFTVFVKLVMPFYKLLNWKKQWKIWSGFGSDPPPQFGNFSHIIPFFSLTTILMQCAISELCAKLSHIGTFCTPAPEVCKCEHSH